MSVLFNLKVYYSCLENFRGLWYYSNGEQKMRLLDNVITNDMQSAILKLGFGAYPQENFSKIRYSEIEFCAGSIT